MLAKLAPILIVMALFLLPVALNAGHSSGGIVPCTGTAEHPCDFCSLIKLADNIIDFLIGLLAVLAAIMFAYAGFLMVTASGDEGKLSQAKGTFRNVTINIIITLAAWLIVDTIMKLLLKEEFGPWNEIVC